MHLNELSATEAAGLIAKGEITSEELVRACLDRIGTREPVVKAWSTIEPELAIREARRRDQEPPRGPLHGVAIAVKDVLDTADLATEMGSPIYRGHRPRADAACVAQARAAGAVVLGKTVTAEFAFMAPGPTANPHNPLHTPGGSSSGSAAAVADFMVPLAFGTQTGGSVQRPASYCGIVGYKPTFGTINRAGLKFAAESLDTIGVMARSIEDVALLRGVCTGSATKLTGLPPDTPPRVGLCRTYLWSKASAVTKEAVESAATRLEQAGVQVAEVVLPEAFGGLTEARDVINNVERARAMAYEWVHRRQMISPQLTDCIERGLATPYERYIEALRLAEHCRIALDSLVGPVDVLLSPSATDEAPVGLHWTGDSTFQGLWTLLHAPTVSLPTHLGPNGLPVGIQLIAARHRDDELLRTAAWVLQTLGAAPINKAADTLVA